MIKLNYSKQQFIIPRHFHQCLSGSDVLLNFFYVSRAEILIKQIALQMMKNCWMTHLNSQKNIFVCHVYGVSDSSNVRFHPSPNSFRSKKSDYFIQLQNLTLSIPLLIITYHKTTILQKTTITMEMKAVIMVRKMINKILPVLCDTIID